MCYVRLLDPRAEAGEGGSGSPVVWGWLRRGAWLILERSLLWALTSVRYSMTESICFWYRAKCYLRAFLSLICVILYYFYIPISDFISEELYFVFVGAAYSPSLVLLQRWLNAKGILYVSWWEGLVGFCGGEARSVGESFLVFWSVTVPCGIYLIVGGCRAEGGGRCLIWWFPRRAQGEVYRQA